MKYIKTFERYRFIDVLELDDIEKELNHIEKIYTDLKPEKIIDCLYDLEDYGLNVSLISSIFKGSNLIQRVKKTSDEDYFKYYLTPDYYDILKSNINGVDREYLKFITIEMVENFYKIKTQDELDQIWNSRILRNTFSDSIRKETTEFMKDTIYSDWVPCFVLHMRGIKNWEDDINIIDSMKGVQERLLNIYGMEIIITGLQKDPYLMIISKEYIKSL